MSRSYRRPYYTDGYGTRRKRYMKRYANKRVRKTKGVPNGRAYRKYHDPWDICDYKCRWDPNGWIIVKDGELVWVPPLDPEWRVRRK